MKQYGPEFIDLTWGAGGSSAKQTIEIVKTAQSVSKVETMMHLTCTNMPVEMVDEALKVRKRKRSEKIPILTSTVARLPRIVDVKTSWLYVATLLMVKTSGNLAKVDSTMPSI
jgi:hypothetical protein